MKIQIALYQPMETRPCRYCLVMQAGSVFVDLDVDDMGCLFVVRISYDGYGCCHPVHVTKFDKTTSLFIVNCIENMDFESEGVSDAFCNYFSANKDVLWDDALIDHGLIKFGAS